MLMLIFMGAMMGRTTYIQSNKGEEMITYMLTRWALPCYMFYNVVSSFTDREAMLRLLANLPVPFGLIGIFLLLGLTLSRLPWVRPGREGVFINSVGFSNTVLLGFPVVTALFGEQIISVAMIYYMANTILFYTAGIWMLGRDAGCSPPIFSSEGMKKLFSPPIVGLLLGILAKLAQLPMPEFVMSFLSMVSALCPCMGMLFIGISIQKHPIRTQDLFPEVAILLAVRYLLAPAVVGLVLRVLPLPNETKAVYLILATMPAMTQMGVMSRALGSDYRFASLWVAVSSTLGMAFLPVMTLTLQYVWHFV